jgi:hypothetical protein
MNPTKIYRIVGTGLDLDGCLVTIQTAIHPDFFAIKPLNQNMAVGSLLIHKKYLIELDSIIQKTDYTITIEKRGASGLAAETLTYENVSKNLDLSVISDLIDLQLRKKLYK